jgi:hypothetical protein
VWCQIAGVATLLYTTRASREPPQLFGGRIRDDSLSRIAPRSRPRKFLAGV